MQMPVFHVTFPVVPLSGYGARNGHAIISAGLQVMIDFDNIPTAASVLLYMLVLALKRCGSRSWFRIRAAALC